MKVNPVTHVTASALVAGRTRPQGWYRCSIGPTLRRVLQLCSTLRMLLGMLGDTRNFAALRRGCRARRAGVFRASAFFSSSASWVGAELNARKGNCLQGLAFGNRIILLPRRLLVPVREGPPQPAPPPKDDGNQPRASQIDRAGIWTGVAVIVFVVLLAILFIAPGHHDRNTTPSQRVEKTVPVPDSTPNPKQ